MTPPIVKNSGLERTDPLGAGGHAGYSPLEGSEGAPSQKMDAYSVPASESFLDKILTGVGRRILSIFSAPWPWARAAKWGEEEKPGGFSQGLVTFISEHAGYKSLPGAKDVLTGAKTE